MGLTRRCSAPTAAAGEVDRQLGAMMADKFPYQYGSDVHWLWAWGNNLQLRFEGSSPPNRNDWVLFRPSKSAARSLQRLSPRFDVILGPVWSAYEQCEKWFDQVDSNQQALDNFYSCIGSLARRILDAAEAIYHSLEGSNRQPDTKEALVLQCLKDARGSGTMKYAEIAAATEVSTRSLKDIVPAVEQLGWISRKGQRGGFFITPKGEAILNA